MHVLPLNATQAFELWPSFSPGEWLDFNPTVVTLADGQQLAFIRRDRVPPVPGNGTIWSVPVDAALRPIGIPGLVIPRGEDPRAVLVGERLFLFYVVIEKDSGGQILGSCVMLAELNPTASPPSVIATFQLPKNPTGNTSLANVTWEKNWVPFVVDSNHIMLIYEHNPWTVLQLNVATEGAAPWFVTAHTGKSLVWAYGDIRGGTPPVNFDGKHLVTFFHSCQVVGSRSVYMVGACIFSNEPPFGPVWMTIEPLLIAPYRSIAARFGWNILASVIFPLGASQRQDVFKLLCGLDDGEIGAFAITADVLTTRLEIVREKPSVSIVVSDANALKLPEGPIILTPHPDRTRARLPLARFLCMLPKQSGTYLDIGAEEGLYAIYLSGWFDRIIVMESLNTNWLLRNIQVNVVKNVELLNSIDCNDEILSSIETVGLIRICSVAQIEVLRNLEKLLRRSLPIVVLDLKGSPKENMLLMDTLREWGYVVEHLFPLTPEVVLCTTVHHREACSWLL